MEQLSKEDDKKVKVDRSGLIGCLKGYLSEEAVDYLTDPARDKEIEKDFLEALGEDVDDQSDISVTQTN
jgi:hypothetical protein